jgi:predicted small lipoprotein YifL
MLINKQILVSAMILFAGVPNLTACGQTGSLYLPARSTPTKQNTTPVVAPESPVRISPPPTQ